MFFLRTLVGMASKTDNVIAFPGVRVAAEPATLVIGATLEAEPRSVHRVFGINDQLSLGELSRALAVIFGWRGNVPTKFQVLATQVESPASLGAQGVRVGRGSHGSSGGHGLPGSPVARAVRARAPQYLDVPDSTTIAEVLQVPGDKILWQWGLWTHTLQVREAFARDDATPDALCIGGSGTVHALGDLDGEDTIDIAAINEELTGRDSIQTTLAATRADVVDVIERSGVFEFVPLLQALDLHRTEPAAVELGGAEGDDVVKRLRALPLEDTEDDPAGHDAALVNMLCLAALTSDELRHDVAAHVMESLGWVGDDGAPLSGEDIEHLCPRSWEEMCELGLCGEYALPPVARLDLLRETLRR